MSSEDLIREAQDPATPPARLAEIAQADRSTWPAIVFHPAAYDGLLQWLGERGDPTVNAALAARTAQFASQQAPAQPAAPVPPAAAAPAAPVAAPVAQPPVEEPTAEIPAEPAPIYSAPEPTPEPAPVYSAPEPTAVFPTQPAAYPAAYPTAGAPAAAFGAVPPGGAEAQPAGTDGPGKGNGKPLGIVIAMVAVIILLIGGAAFGATKVFGGDDDNDDVTASDTKQTEKPDTSDDDDATTAAPAVPTIPTPDSSGASSDFCVSMKAVQDQSMDMLGDSTDTPDLDSMQDKADDMIKSYQALEQAAPDEIKADVRTMASYLDMLKNPTAESAEGFDMKSYTEAAQRVGVYYAKNCL